MAWNGFYQLQLLCYCCNYVDWGHCSLLGQLTSFFVEKEWRWKQKKKKNQRKLRQRLAVWLLFWSIYFRTRQRKSNVYFQYWLISVHFCVLCKKIIIIKKSKVEHIKCQRWSVRSYLTLHDIFHSNSYSHNLFMVPHLSIISSDYRT